MAIYLCKLHASCMPMFAGAGRTDRAKLMFCCLLRGFMSPLKLDVWNSKSGVSLKYKDSIIGSLLIIYKFSNTHPHVFSADRGKNNLVLELHLGSAWSLMVERPFRFLISKFGLVCLMRWGYFTGQSVYPNLLESQFKIYQSWGEFTSLRTWSNETRSGSLVGASHLVH